MTKPAENLNSRIDPADDNADPDRTLLSCLLDGELDETRCSRICELLRADAQAHRDWELMNVACDALRSSEVASWHRHGFAQRLSRTLADEPTVLSPRRTTRRWRRWIGSGAAVAAAGALVFAGFNQLQTRVDAPGAVTAAAGPPGPATPQVATLVAPVEVPVERLPAMERYVAAHRELARPAVMPDATPYLRTSATMRVEGPR